MERRNTFRAWMSDVGYLYGIVTAIVAVSMLVTVVSKTISSSPPHQIMQPARADGPPGHPR